MCGIVGIVGDKPVSERIYNALKTLEYRGYDSAGIATLISGERHMRKAVGKLSALGLELSASPLEGDIGIGHTRWATHGAPTIENTHPHISGPVCVVHNGIIENYSELRQNLIAQGYSFYSETDTETIAVSIHAFLDQGLSPIDAFQKTISQLEGAFSLGVLIDNHGEIFAARRGSPLAIGYGMGENYLGSDSIALAGFTNRVTYLNDGDWAVLTREEVRIFDALGNRANREIKIVNVDQMVIDKGRHRHFMAKEIHDQPSVLAYVLSHYLNDDRTGFDFKDMDKLNFTEIERITLIACGTAYFSCYVAKYWIEELAKIPCEVEIASEFRYREPPLQKGQLVAFVSQSGETADTLAALHYAKTQNAQTIGLVNSEESTIAREADLVLPLKAGPELSVASTKAFTAQLTVLAVLSLMMAKAKSKLDHAALQSHLAALTSVPRIMTDILGKSDQALPIAQSLSSAQSVLFLGRGALFPLALEGALKLKEITYIHAEGYASGELKHGPIALIDEHLPVVVFAPHDRLIEKTISNMQEVAARGGKITLVTDQKGKDIAGEGSEHLWILPEVDEFIAPIIYALPAQFIAYFTAVDKGTDVDQPRNLAKSVTVE